MKFETRELAAHFTQVEHGLYAIDPRQGNDAALLAVFDNPRSPAELARFLTWMYDQYLHAAPMEPATDAQKSGGHTPTRCTCHEYPGSDEFCTAHRPPSRSTHG